MKPDIHPKLFETKVSCACGENFTTAGTVKEIKVEICAKCHPFFTGRQKFVDTAGRVERFRAIFGQEVKPREKVKRHKPVPTKKVLSKPAEDGEPEAEDEAKAEAKAKAAPEADAKG